MADTLSLTDSLLNQILKGQQATAERVAELSATVAQINSRLDRLDERLTKMASCVHTPPCRRLEDAERRIEAIEVWKHDQINDAKATKARFGNLFWNVVGYLVTGALGVLGTLLVLGGKSYFQN